ncbi:MAG: endonuclease III [Treponema sp.]|nr:endonuclease III [Treponema sp.]
MSKKQKLLKKDDIVTIFERFKARNAEPASELKAPNPYCLLVSVVLSAQATDKSVNAATEPLYKTVSTPQQMLALGKEGLISYIRSIGLYNSKAEHVMQLSAILVDRYAGNIPSTREELMSLPGVGRKTANVILNVVYHQPTMPVDTHLMRICPKIGLAQGSTPLEIELSLLQNIPSQYMMHAHHWLILHGRYICTARNPKCAECCISDICQHNTKQNAAKATT